MQIVARDSSERNIYHFAVPLYLYRSGFADHITYHSIALQLTRSTATQYSSRARPAKDWHYFLAPNCRPFPHFHLIGKCSGWSLAVRCRCADSFQQRRTWVPCCPSGMTELRIVRRVIANCERMPLTTSMWFWSAPCCSKNRTISWCPPAAASSNGDTRSGASVDTFAPNLTRILTEHIWP